MTRAERNLLVSMAEVLVMIGDHVLDRDQDQDVRRSLQRVQDYARVVWNQEGTPSGQSSGIEIETEYLLKIRDSAGSFRELREIAGKLVEVICYLRNTPPGQHSVEDESHGE